MSLSRTKAAIMKWHDNAKYLRIWNNEREAGKTGTNFMYLSQFDKVFSSFKCFFNTCFCAKFCQSNWIAKNNLILQSLEVTMSSYHIFTLSKSHNVILSHLKYVTISHFKMQLKTGVPWNPLILYLKVISWFNTVLIFS